MDPDPTKPSENIPQTIYDILQKILRNKLSAYYESDDENTRLVCRKILDFISSSDRKEDMIFLINLHGNVPIDYISIIQIAIIRIMNNMKSEDIKEYSSEMKETIQNIKKIMLEKQRNQPETGEVWKKHLLRMEIISGTASTLEKIKYRIRSIITEVWVDMVISLYNILKTKINVLIRSRDATTIDNNQSIHEKKKDGTIASITTEEKKEEIKEVNRWRLGILIGILALILATMVVPLQENVKTWLEVAMLLITIIIFIQVIISKITAL